MIKYDSENKRILTDTDGDSIVVIPGEDTENRRVNKTYDDSVDPVDPVEPSEGLYLVDRLGGLYSVEGGGVPDPLLVTTPIYGVYENSGDYFVDESKVRPA